MKAYILRTGTLIPPFNDPPGEARILDRTVEERREETLRQLGLEAVYIDKLGEINEDEYLLIADYVHCSPACLKAFLKAVRQHRQSRRLALESNPQIEMSLPMQDLDPLPPAREGGPAVYGFDVYYHHYDHGSGLRVDRGPGVRDDHASRIPDDRDLGDRGYARPGAPPVDHNRLHELPSVHMPGISTFAPDELPDLPPEVVPVKQRVVEVDPPFYVRVKEKNRIGMSRTWAMHLKHWTHIYLANYAALTALPFEWFPRKLLWVLWRVLTAFSLNPFKLMRRLVIKGKRCSIHPTAVVEASVLGNRVSVGAHAVVRGSYVADGARIGEAAKVIGSVIGQKSEIPWNSIVSLAVLYPGACVGTPGVQTALVGREAFVSSMVLPLDVKFKGGFVSVRHRGRTVTTRLTTLGPCFGHGSRVGAGVTVNCGREIPNGVDILPNPGPVLSRVPEGLPPGSTYTVANGTLVAVDRGSPDQGADEAKSLP